MKKWTVSLLLCLFSLLLVACGGKGAAEEREQRREKRKIAWYMLKFRKEKLWIHKIPRNNILKDR